MRIAGDASILRLAQLRRIEKAHGLKDTKMRPHLPWTAEGRRLCSHFYEDSFVAWTWETRGRFEHYSVLNSTRRTSSHMGFWQIAPGRVWWRERGLLRADGDSGGAFTRKTAWRTTKVGAMMRIPMDSFWIGLSRRLRDHGT